MGVRGVCIDKEWWTSEKEGIVRGAGMTSLWAVKVTPQRDAVLSDPGQTPKQILRIARHSDGRWLSWMEIQRKRVCRAI